MDEQGSKVYKIQRTKLGRKTLLALSSSSFNFLSPFF